MEYYKSINDYQGLYEISTLGNVRSVTRKVRHLDHFITIKSRILKPYLGTNGYYMVALSNEGKTCKFPIHRLVATAFIKLNNDKPCVNHIDGDKLNNKVNNLEWSTYSENNKHAYDSGLKIGFWTGKRGKEHHNSKAVCQYSLQGVFIKEFDSIMDASRETGIYDTSISLCCRNKQKTSGKYMWKYK